MDKNITTTYENIYQKNLVLLEIARKGDWQHFIELAADYVVALQDAIAGYSDDLNPDEKEQLKYFLQRLIDNEDIIMHAMKGRLDTLRQDMSSLNLGKKCNLAYSINFTSTLQ